MCHLELVGVEQNANQPPNVVNLSKSIFLHTVVMQRIVEILCQIVAADIDRSYKGMIR